MSLIDAVFQKARRVVRTVREHLAPPPAPEGLIAGRLDGLAAKLARCKGQLVLLFREERELKLAIQRNTNRITHHLREARLCSARGEDETAAAHLCARHRRAHVGATLERQLTDFRGQIERLVNHVRGLELVVEDARRRKQLLVAQRECFQAHLLIQGATAGSGSVHDLLEELEREVLTMQVLADVTTGPGGALPSRDELTLEDEVVRRHVADELALFKRQLIGGPSRDRERTLSPAVGDDVLYITG